MRSDEPLGLGELGRPVSRGIPDEVASVTVHRQSAVMIRKVDRTSLPLAKPLGDFPFVLRACASTVFSPGLASAAA